MIAILFFGCIQYATVSFDIEHVAQYSPIGYWETDFCPPPNKKDWQVEKIVDLINEDCRGVNRTVIVALYMYENNMDNKYFDYFLLLKQLPHIDILTRNELLSGGANVREDVLFECDYVVTKGYSGEFTQIGASKEATVIREPPDGFDEAFELMEQTFRLPDGTYVRIYNKVS